MTAERVGPAGLVVLSLLAGLSGLAACRRGPDDAPVKFQAGGLPTSSDPIDLDLSRNVMGLAPVYSGLVGYHSPGEFTGVLAETWSSSEDFKRWEFRLRRGLRYETGEEIVAADVVGSWLRLARKMADSGSEGTFLSDLEGFAEFSEGRGPLIGLKAEGDVVQLSFSRPVPRLLAPISETMFSVVSPRCYDAATGAWLCAGRAVSSGPYRVARWDEEVFEIALRDDFPDRFRHPRAFRRIQFKASWGSGNSDVAFGSSHSKPSSPAYTFHGGMESGVSFARCVSWNRPGSVCHRREDRRRLRDAFYRELLSRGFRPARSFLPLLIPGVEEAPLEAGPSTPVKGGGLVKVDRFGSRTPFAVACEESAAAAAVAVGAGFEKVDLGPQGADAMRDPDLPAYPADVVFYATEITPDQAASSVKYMFVSHEGIRLPDPTGRIRASFRDGPVDFQRVNALLWEDALVWPLEHFSWGTWAKPGFDRSLLNTAIPSPRLHWIGRKE